MQSICVSIALYSLGLELVDGLSFSQPFSIEKAALAIERRSFRASFQGIEGCRADSGEEGFSLCEGLPSLGDGVCFSNDLTRIISKTSQPDWNGDKCQLIRIESPRGFLPTPLPQFDVNHPSAPSSEWQVLHPKGVFALDGFLTDAEADAFVLQMGNRAGESISSGVTEPVLPTCGFRRSTTWVFFTHQRQEEPFPDDYMQRMEKATGVTMQHYEPTQIVEYAPGDFFSDHYDTAPCDHIGSQKLPEVQDVHLLKHLSCEDKTRRQATVIVYLTGESDGEGGATYFPKLDVRVKPKKGRAILFHPTRADGSVDPWMLHTAETLTSGKKFLLQQWIMHGTE